MKVSIIDHEDNDDSDVARARTEGGGGTTYEENNVHGGAGGGKRGVGHRIRGVLYNVSNSSKRALLETRPSNTGPSIIVSPEGGKKHLYCSQSIYCR